MPTPPSSSGGRREPNASQLWRGVAARAGSAPVSSGARTAPCMLWRALGRRFCPPRPCENDANACSRPIPCTRLTPSKWPLPSSGRGGEHARIRSSRSMSAYVKRRGRRDSKFYQSKRRCAGVAKWQTRGTQEALPACTQRPRPRLTAHLPLETARLDTCQCRLLSTKPLPEPLPGALALSAFDYTVGQARRDGRTPPAAEIEALPCGSDFP